MYALAVATTPAAVLCELCWTVYLCIKEDTDPRALDVFGRWTAVGNLKQRTPGEPLVHEFGPFPAEGPSRQA